MGGKISLIMNLLPGIRDARTPFSVAVIWLLAAVMWWPIIRPDQWNFAWLANYSFLLQDAEFRSASIGTFTVLLLAYLLGLLTVSIGRLLSFALSVFTQLLLLFSSFIVVPVFGVVLVTWLVSSALSTAWFLLKPLFWLLALLGVLALNSRSILSRPMVKLLDFLDQHRSILRGIRSPLSRASLIAMAVLGGLGRRMTLRITYLSPTLACTRRVMAFQLAKELQNTPADRELLFKSLPLRFCISIALENGIPVPDSLAFDDEKESWPNLVLWINLAWTWGDLDGVSRNSVRLSIQNAILKDHIKDPTALVNLLIMYVKVPYSLRREMKRRMKSAPLLLRVSSPLLYEEYDRLKTEGEFRSAISLPLAFAVFGAVLNILPLTVPGYYVISLAFACSGVIGVIFLALGSARRAASDRLISQCVEAALIDLPTPSWKLTDKLVLKSSLTTGALKRGVPQKKQPETASALSSGSMT